MRATHPGHRGHSRRSGGQRSRTCVPALCFLVVSPARREGCWLLLATGGSARGPRLPRQRLPRPVTVSTFSGLALQDPRGGDRSVDSVQESHHRSPWTRRSRSTRSTWSSSRTCALPGLDNNSPSTCLNTADALQTRSGPPDASTT